MTEKCKESPRFVCNFGTYKLKIMPSGLLSAPSTFQCMVDITLRGSLLVEICPDDVGNLSPDILKHVGLLEEVFAVIPKSGIKLKLFKRFYVMPQVKLLGHSVAANGIQRDSEKIVVSKDAPVPKSTTVFRSFSKQRGYCRRFIQNSAETSSSPHVISSETKD